ncbi:MAG TPA: CvpA family protein [Chitinophagaceae bacterium]|nr:CvpA family protein [Chitinophagaceae bacterium]
MNWIDVLLVLIFLLCLWGGWNKGFITGILDLAGWVGSLIIGFLCYKYTAVLLQKVFDIGVWTFPLAFMLTIILARLIFSIITNSITSSTSQETHTNVANRFLGLLPGAINGIIYACIAAALFLSLPFSDNFSEAVKRSKLAGPLAMRVEWAEARIAPIFNKALNQSLNGITLHPKSNETVTLPFKVSSSEPRPELEAQMLVLVNEERKKAGLKELLFDAELLKVARAHSVDMFVRGYFSHFSPEGKASSDRIEAAGIRYSIAGENLALGQTLEICHSGLMNSPGHRANILQKKYGRVGIGILDGGRRGLMVTQNFRN